MNQSNIQMILRALPIALIVAFSAQASAQNNKIELCGRSGGPTKIYDGVIVPPGGSASAGNTAELKSLSNYCAPPAPDFVTEDSRLLLAKIKLAKLQNDSIKQLTKAFAVRQKTIADERALAIGKERRNAATTPPRETKAEARRLYLTPAMQELRNMFALLLRGTLAAEQTAQFDTNLAALKKKDG